MGRVASLSYFLVLPVAWLAATSGFVLKRIRAQVLRERLRGLVRFLYHAALHAIPARGHDSVVAVSLDPVSRLLSSRGYDAATTAWATTVLRGRLRPPVSPEDPEAAHDLLRLRGVLPLLAEEYSRSQAEPLLHRMLDLIRETNALVNARPAVGWDTTTAALRAVSLLQTAEHL